MLVCVVFHWTSRILEVYGDVEIPVCIVIYGYFMFFVLLDTCVYEEVRIPVALGVFRYFCVM